MYFRNIMSYTVCHTATTIYPRSSGELKYTKVTFHFFFTFAQRNLVVSYCVCPFFLQTYNINNDLHKLHCPDVIKSVCDSSMNFV